MTDAVGGRSRRAVLLPLLCVLALAATGVPAVAATAQTSTAADRDTFEPAMAPPPSWPEPTGVTARAHLLLDADTGQVLAARNADERRPVASTVKLLTVLAALPTLDLDATVTVGTEVAGLEGALVGLEPGERWTVRALLEAVLVRSGNDAARALAAASAGSVPAFVARMRAVAAGLGLEGLTLASPSGLRDENLLSARDLGVLARAALREPVLVEIAGLPSVTLPDVGTDENRNLLLERYPGAIGLKTGYTTAAGWSVVGAAERDGRTLVAVVLAASSADQRFTDAARLLDYGFALERDDEVFRRVVKVAGSAVVERAAGPGLLAPDGEVTAEVDLGVEPPRRGRRAPVTWAGEPIGEVRTVVEPADRIAEGLGATLVDGVYDALRAAAVEGRLTGGGLR